MSSAPSSEPATTHLPLGSVVENAAKTQYLLFWWPAAGAISAAKHELGIRVSNPLVSVSGIGLAVENAANRQYLLFHWPAVGAINAAEHQSGMSESKIRLPAF